MDAKRGADNVCSRNCTFWSRWPPLRSIKDILIRKKITKISNNPIDHLHYHQQGRAAARAAAKGDGGRGGGGQGGESQGDDGDVGGDDGGVGGDDGDDGGQDFGDNRDDAGVDAGDNRQGHSVGMRFWIMVINGSW